MIGRCSFVLLKRTLFDNWSPWYVYPTKLCPLLIAEGGVFFCPYCMETFRYPNCLRAHMRFKCDHRRHIHPMGLTGIRPTGPIPRDVHERLFPTLGFDYRSANLDKATHGAFPYPGYPHFRLPVSTSVATTSSDQQSHMLPSPASSTSSTSLSAGKHSPAASDRSGDGRESWNPARASPDKRHIEESSETELPAKKLAVEDLSGRTSVPSPVERPRSSDSQQSLSGKEESSPINTGNTYKGKLDRNENIHDLSDDENISAFRKVEKHMPRSNQSPPLTVRPMESSSMFGPVPSAPSTLYTPTPINGMKTAMANQEKGFHGGVPHPSFLPRLALIPGTTGMPPAFMPRNNYNENLPLNMSDLYRNSLNSKFGPEMPRPTSEKLADIHNIENNNVHPKMSFMPDGRAMTMPMTAFYKSQNPMVEKLLQSPVIPTPAPFALNLTQNWCAKCNATFRMTSDLVYHMRSHHKEAPIKKMKREDKLKCTVCGETFRERHHLTRHMTSHQ